MGDFSLSDVLAEPGQKGYGEAISFGPFTLFPEERRLEQGGRTMRLGSRALDILIVLIQNAGEVVDRRILMSRAWRNIVVDESNLRVNIAGLRKALGDGEGGVQYVRNVPGIGYCFVGQLTRERTTVQSCSASDEFADAIPPRRFPSDPVWLFGRDDAIQSLAFALVRRRLISIVGPGGIGKSSVALALAHKVADAFLPEIQFVDLGALTNGESVASALAYRLGISDLDGEPLARLGQHLSNRRALIILDNCEHLVADVAALVERVMSVSAEIHFVATTREALRIKGEYVYRLPALGTPPPGEAMSAEEVHTYPAAQLFIERACAAGATFEPTARSCASIATICCGLDGVPLAIEIAAARVATFGLGGVSSLLGTRSRIQWQGSRNAPLRQRNLEASIDWSHRLLSERERLVFRRLSILDEPATLEAVLATAAHTPPELAETIEAIEGLVARHLLIVLPGPDDQPLYRLLESERIFAREKLRLADVDALSDG